jgi:hypothetical protein
MRKYWLETTTGRRRYAIKGVNIRDRYEVVDFEDGHNVYRKPERILESFLKELAPALFEEPTAVGRVYRNLLSESYYAKDRRNYPEKLADFKVFSYSEKPTDAKDDLVKRMEETKEVFWQSKIAVDKGVSEYEVEAEEVNVEVDKDELPAGVIYGKIYVAVRFGKREYDDGYIGTARRRQSEKLKQSRKSGYELDAVQKRLSEDD